MRPLLRGIDSAVRVPVWDRKALLAVARGALRCRASAAAGVARERAGQGFGEPRV